VTQAPSRITGLDVRLRGCAASADNLRVAERDRVACQPKLARWPGERRLAERVGFVPLDRSERNALGLFLKR
jgi:hypothetical protein